MSEYKDKDVLKRLYHDERMTQKEIGEKFGVSQGTIAYYINKYDIKTRGPSGLWDDEKPWEEEERLRELYHEKRMSTWEIADELDCSQKTVMRAMDELGVETREYSESNRLKFLSSPASFDHSVQGYERWQSPLGGVNQIVLVHRLLAVAEYGFDAVADNHVHHKNELKWDNRPRNIEVLSPSEHIAEHQVHGNGITPEMCKEVREKHGEVDPSKLAEKFDVQRQTVNAHARGDCMCDEFR